MITYTKLGQMGRLGNQMFQYAALYGTAFLRGYEIGVPDEDLSIRQIFKLPSAKFSKDLSPSLRYGEPSFNFAGNIWLIDDDTDIFGYFQSPNYWLHCRETITEEFSFKDEIEEQADKWLIDNGLTNEGKVIPLCSIHVRRGDYLNLSHYHYNLDIEEYYKKAVEFMNQNIQHQMAFLVFSDDPEWCKQSFTGALVVEGNSEGLDMCLMSKCHAHIIANSSFSWWGATLSGSQAVIAPNLWFGPDGPANWESLYWDHWARI